MLVEASDAIFLPTLMSCSEVIVLDCCQCNDNSVVVFLGTMLSCFPVRYTDNTVRTVVSDAADTMLIHPSHNQASVSADIVLPAGQSSTQIAAEQLLSAGGVRTELVPASSLDPEQAKNYQGVTVTLVNNEGQATQSEVCYRGSSMECVNQHNQNFRHTACPISLLVILECHISVLIILAACMCYVCKV